MVDQSGDLGVGVGRNEAAAELVALTDIDEPCVVLRIATQGEKFLQQHRDLHSVGCGQ